MRLPLVRRRKPASNPCPKPCRRYVSLMRKLSPDAKRAAMRAAWRAQKKSRTIFRAAFRRFEAKHAGNDGRWTKLRNFAGKGSPRQRRLEADRFMVLREDEL